MRKIAATSDTDLLIRLQKGDQEAFSVVFELYFLRLHNFSYRFTKDKEQSREIIQEVFISLWLNCSKLDPSYPLSPYLYTIARRLTLNSLRRAGTSQAAIETLWNKAQKVSNQTEEVIFLDDLEAFIQQALLKLPKQQQLVFKMSRMQDLSYDQISEELQISRYTVKNHLVAALKNLRIQLNKAFSFLL